MIELQAPTFPSADRYGLISCGSVPSPVKGVPVRVMIQPGMAIGDVITLETRGFLERDETQPVEGTEFSFTFTLDTISDKFQDVICPYETAIKPIGSGWLRAGYSLKPGNGAVVISPNALVLVEVRLSNGQTCPE